MDTESSSGRPELDRWAAGHQRVPLAFIDGYEGLTAGLRGPEEVQACLFLRPVNTSGSILTPLGVEAKMAQRCELHIQEAP